MVLLKFTLCLVIGGVVGLHRIKIDDSDHAGTYLVDYDERVRLEINFEESSDDLIYSTPRHDIQVIYPPTSDATATANDDDAFDSWSVVWYIASFGGLIGFFLVVSCSEWCCRKHIRDSQPRTSPAAATSVPSSPSESPPPAYDLFAPPSYDSLTSSPNNEKREYDIYVVPVHAIGSLVESENARQENPPSYSSINIEEGSTTAVART